MRRLLPRKRTIFGGVLLAGIVAGIYFGDKLPHLGSGFGLGSGGDNVLGKSDTRQVVVNASNKSAASEHEATNDSADPSQDHDGMYKKRKPRLPDNVPDDGLLTILVDDRQYAVWRKTRRGNGYLPAELPAVVKLALKAPANEEGFRVRIMYTKTARYSAWQTLQQELVTAGLTADAILVHDESVE